jgi:hypothetical protein
LIPSPGYPFRSLRTSEPRKASPTVRWARYTASIFLSAPNSSKRKTNEQEPPFSPQQSPSVYAFVCLNQGDDALPITEGLDPELFPVFPDSQAYDKATILLTKSSSGEARTLTLKFPFVCAVGATVYKVQRESLQSMAVVDWKVDGSRANKQQQAYLMVSRVVKREAIVCLHPFTPALAAWSKPSVGAVEEDKRLARESERSLLDFHKALRPRR